MSTPLMQIVIPTRGRISKQLTLERLSPAARARTTLVCPADEVSRHRGRVPADVTVMAQPDHIRTIAAKRAWIMREWHARGVERLLMLDDDLAMHVRRTDDRPDRLKFASDHETDRWLGELESRLSPDLPHAGFGARQGNNQQEAGWQRPGRMMYSLGYHLPTVMANVELERVLYREDMDVTLQLLRAGFPNEVCHTFVCGQSGFGAKGGCADERTIPESDAAAEKLAALHPGYVKVVQREYKSVPRKEVMCYWKRALEDGLAARRQREAA